MALEQRLIQSQKLVLSPQLRQYLKLLQLPLLELKQAVEQEMSENPVLEEVSLDEEETPASSLSNEAEPATPPKESVRELDFQDKLSQLERIDEEFKDSRYSEAEYSGDGIKETSQKKDYQESIITKETTLADYLLWQINLLDLTPEETKIAQEIIGNVDEDGYLRMQIAEISESIKNPPADVENVLKKLQTLDPPGVCAKNLQEALLIQLSKWEGTDTAVSQAIVKDCFELLEKKHFSEIAKKMSFTEDQVRNAFHQIARLEPKPGRIFFSNEPVAMIPDSTVSADDDEPGKYKIEIHDESVPRLKISSSYRQMLKEKNLDAPTKVFLKAKMNSALWLMQALAQRKSTIRSITEEIVKAQPEFFEKGFAFLKPLRLKDIAEKIGIHESTVSRAIASKYIVTPQGTIPYRSFFSNKMETQDGSLESQKSITERIKKMVEQEDRKKPLSDEKITKLLKSEGILIARRTVAKYREILRILPTHLRKEK